MVDVTQLTKTYQNLQEQIKKIEELANTLNYPIGTRQVVPVAPTNQVPKQLSAEIQASVPQEMLLNMYDEFALTDDGKALASQLSKFARFVQSKVAKAS